MSDRAEASYGRLLDALAEAGALEAGWRAAFEAAPRDAFVPDVVWAPDASAERGFRRVSREREPGTWWALVASDGVVVTQLDDGAPDGPGVATSSASMPSLVATMLAELDVTEGDRVLDVGTGTGWTAALLSHRVGASGQVVTVEVDPALAAEASRRLADAGLRTRCVTGDGLAGWAPGAPYDRVHAAMQVREVPRAWLAQTRPGGVIVTPWGTPYAVAALLRMVAGGPGEPSHGRFTGGVTFMWARSQRPGGAGGAGDAGDAIANAAEGETVVGPSALNPVHAVDDPHAAFAISLRVPGLRYDPSWDLGAAHLHVSDGAGSHATVRHPDWSAPDAVRQTGPRRLWDAVTAAHAWWTASGRPTFPRFGLTAPADPDTPQYAWLDTPDNPVLTARTTAP
jgi:protein-L-isoaspartate O-methyltransferase